MNRLSSRRIRAGSIDNTVNPMDGLGNLADAMLVLAVGIMLALIINWKVDITTFGVETPETEETEEQIAIDAGDLQDPAEQPDETDMQRVGALYFDEATGSYYAVMGEG